LPSGTSNEPTDLVGFGGALTHQLLADAVRGLRILLGDTLHEHEPHTGATHRLTDRLGIDPIVLVALDVGLDELRTEELHAKTPLLELTRPVMSRGTGFHPHLGAGSKALPQCIQPLAALELGSPLGLVMPIHGMYLENGLRNIHTGSANVH
jgi:hypothetical protein